MRCTPPTAFAAAGVSVIVPVYNEAPGVHQTLVELTATMRGLGWPFEVLVIDDGSTDTSRQEIARIDDPAIRIIAHPTNQGYGASLTDGLRAARFPTMVITDADGTYPLDHIPQLVAGLAHHVMVVGARTKGVVRRGSPRSLVKWGLRQLATVITGQPIPDLNSGLRAMRREAILPLIPMLPKRFSWTSTVTVALLLQQQPVAFLPIPYYLRAGASKIHPIADTIRAVQCILRAALDAHPGAAAHPHHLVRRSRSLCRWILTRTGTGESRSGSGTAGSHQ